MKTPEEQLDDVTQVLNDAGIPTEDVNFYHERYTLTTAQRVNRLVIMLRISESQGGEAIKWRNIASRHYPAWYSQIESTFREVERAKHC